MQWYSGRGHVKWLTDVVAVGKSNDWLMCWQGAGQMTDWCGNMLMQWCGGRGQVKWQTDVVAGHKSNDWLMWWCSNALSLVLALALSLVLSLLLALALALEIWATWRNFRYLIISGLHMANSHHFRTCTNP